MRRRSTRSPLEKPPRVSWKLGPGKQYAAFLSHYKMEAGMEARYLRDLLQKMLRQPCFLDSQNLMNLKDLFGNGLQRSDVLVLFATKDVLRRPYCLLELWVAQRTGVPIVILDISGQKEISWAEAKHVLADIENALDEPSVQLIESTLSSIVAEIGTEGEEPPALSQFGTDIALALRMEDRASATFHAWGTDNEILAAASELVDMMSLSVGAAAPQLARTHLLSKRQRKALDLAKSAPRDAVQSSERPPQAPKHHHRTSVTELLSGFGMARHALTRRGSTRECVRRELMASPDHGEPSPRARAALCISCRRGDTAADDDATAALESARFLQEVASRSFEHHLTFCPPPPKSHVPPPRRVQALPALLGGSVQFEPEDLMLAGPHEREDHWAHMAHFNVSQSGGRSRRHSAAPGENLDRFVHMGRSGLTLSWGSSSSRAGEDQPRLTKKRRAQLCKQLSERLLEGVAGAQAVLLLQTSSVYTDAVRAMPRTQTAALCSWAILARQLTLLELYWAVRQEKPIICLRIQDSGSHKSSYDFGKVTQPFPMPKGKAAPCGSSRSWAWPSSNPHRMQMCQVAAFLDDLESNLKRDAPATAALVSAWMDENMITFQHMAMSLAQHIPNIISIPTVFSPNASENVIAGLLQDIAMRLPSAHLTTPSTAQAMADAIRLPARCSLGSSVVQALQDLQSHFDSCEAPGARLYGQRTAQQLHVQMLAATFIQAVWHGVVVRKKAKDLRTRRDAIFLISLHYAGSRRARRLRRESRRMETDCASPNQAERHLAENMARRMALGRLRAARMREQRIEALKELQRNEGLKELKELNAMAMLIISVHALRWLSRSREAQLLSAQEAQKKLRMKAEEALAAPELDRAKVLIQRSSQRRMSAPTLMPIDMAIMAKANKTAAPFSSSQGLLTRTRA